jgi:hypothetical protein
MGRVPGTKRSLFLRAEHFRWSNRGDAGPVRHIHGPQRWDFPAVDSPIDCWVGPPVAVPLPKT